MRSVVVNQIHVHNLAILETKNDAPVAGDAHAPFPGPIPFQGVQSKAGCICATRMRCLLQPEQDSPKPRDQARGQSRWIVSFVQRSQSLVPDLHRLNVPIVTRYATRCNMSRYTCSLVRLGGHDRGSRQSTRHSGALVHDSKPTVNDPNPEASHRPILYDSGRPSSAIWFMTLHAPTDSATRPPRDRARSRSPIIDLYRKNACSTRAWPMIARGPASSVAVLSP